MTNENKLKIGIISLGCDKNRVDTELMLTFLRDAGYEFTPDPAESDIIIINTCGFISSARKESMDTIIEMSKYKQAGSCKRLVVTGCMPQLWLKEMREELPDVDIFLGIDKYHQIVQILDNSLNPKAKRLIKAGSVDTVPYVQDRVVTTPSHYAYLKIADGCDNYCTFCTIPYIRGKYRSRNMEILCHEAEDLVRGGAREIILIAQDITRYGTDIYGKPALIDLIRELSKIEGLDWIRLLYCYPEEITHELIKEMIVNPKLCKYVDIPLQQVSDPVLKRMNRHTNKQQIVKIIEDMQSQKDFIAIRTTFMVGFPGETEEEFAELYDFIAKYKLTHVGFFAYSKEDNTPSAKMPNQVPEKIKQKRLIKLIKLQRKIVEQNNKHFVGKTYDVCIEGIDYDKAMFFGRTEYQAPEIDTVVYVRAKSDLGVGSVHKVKITKVRGYDLIGEVLE